MSIEGMQRISDGVREGYRMAQAYPDCELALWALTHGYRAERLPPCFDEPGGPSRWQWLGPMQAERFNHKTEAPRGSDIPALDDLLRHRFAAERMAERLLLAATQESEG